MSTPFTDGPVELVAHMGPGSGPMLMLRALADSITEISGRVRATVSARPEDDGGEAIIYVASHAGDSHVAASCTPTYFTTPLKHGYDFSYRNLTPICGLVSDTYLLVVAADDPADDAHELVEKPLTLATAPKGGNTHIHAMLLDGLTTAAVTPCFYESIPAALNAVADGEARATTCVASDIDGHPRASELRILATLAAEGGGLAPTLTSQGIGLVFPLWRGLIGPPDLNAVAVEGWVSLVRKATELETWKRYVEESGMRQAFLDADSFRALLHQEGPRYEEWSRKLAPAS